jgi:hypothetical protein
MSEIVALRDKPDIKISDPVPTKSMSDAARSGLSPQELVQLLEVATAILKTGAASAVFLGALIDLAKKFTGAKIILRDPKTRKDLVEIDDRSDLASVTNKLV